MVVLNVRAARQDIHVNGINGGHGDELPAHLHKGNVLRHAVKLVGFHPARAEESNLYTVATVKHCGESL